MSYLQMSPEPGRRFVRHAGDLLEVELRGVPEGWSARLRTNLGRAESRRSEVVAAGFSGHPIANASWRDIPLLPMGGGLWKLVLPMTQAGFHQAKAYAMDPQGFQHWPDGPDIGISVHPSWTRTSHPIYCAFPRMFGPNKARRSTVDDPILPRLRELDHLGYTVIPPSGTLRDVRRELPHIIDRLGCRMLHLLPVSPTPTTFARFGRFGSPYALQDLTAIDPALVEFDRRTTGIQQFCELAYAVHDRGARLMLDLVINHTGWGSRIWEEHPDWFLRKPNGEFESPGAWDVIWEDLVELDQRHAPLWEHLADAFVTWCRRGVDAFRCDAGYKIPAHVWQHITARVQQEFPETLFLLEGLGGPWEATNRLLSDGGMQWAYSELFQNFSPEAVTGYLDHTIRFADSIGILVHYSETHDNSRLAAKPATVLPTSPGNSATPASTLPSDQPPNLAWSRFRNRLSALSSVQGAFGFTNGVEWGATEQINVHSARGLAWGTTPNLVDELGHLNQLLRGHPCFFDGAKISRLSPDGSPVLVLERTSAEGLDTVLVVINLDDQRPQVLHLDTALRGRFIALPCDLLDTGSPQSTERIIHSNQDALRVEPGVVHCFASNRTPLGLAGEAYQKRRAQADWALACWWGARLERPMGETFDLPGKTWHELADEVSTDPEAFLDRTLGSPGSYRSVVTWTTADTTRVVQIPPRHWLLIRDSVRFRACLRIDGKALEIHVESIPITGGWVAAIAPDRLATPSLGKLSLERYQTSISHIYGTVRVLSSGPSVRKDRRSIEPRDLVLLTNGRGGMSRLMVNLGQIQSKYDCLLGANLNPRLPVDRHVFSNRVRAWVDADGFISQLDDFHLIQFEPGPPPVWRFVAPSGDGRYVAIRLSIDLLDQSNTVVLAFRRDTATDNECRGARPLAADIRVSLTVRIDIEDRSFHAETKRTEGADYHFATHCRPISGAERDSSTPARGFEFAPSPERRLEVIGSTGTFHPEPEWSMNLPHTWESSRGQEGTGDSYSPGWFELPLPETGTVTVVATAEEAFPTLEMIEGFEFKRSAWREQAVRRANLSPDDSFGQALAVAAGAYVVRRDDTRSVIAGYPWFLDWGRDSLIAARGLLAAGLLPEVQELLKTFARFEQGGTLPNSIHGADASNRDTCDAPLWFGIVCEDVAVRLSESQRTSFYATPVDGAGRTVDDVLRSIACGYLAGTANGIQVDAQSGLVWSPSHFTWMDTNYPASTPREGYPVEIQALWIRLLRHLAERQATPWEGRGESWGDLARRAEKSVHLYYWLDDLGWYADELIAARGVSARMSAPRDALRSNCLFLVSLEINRHPDFGQRSKRMVEAATRYLLIPGALRSLAPLPVNPPLPIYRPGGGLLNDPAHPYWPRYEGDEDTRRKPAYHNGTGWLWTFPTFVEALVRAYPNDPSARAAARSYLSALELHLQCECLGQLPEICDGDAPHASRGCDAQAWSVTEALRVWKWLALGYGGGTEPS